MQQQLGDARTGKMAANIVAFGRALRRAGVPVDSTRIGLALKGLSCIDISRKDDVRAALASIMVLRVQDIEVFNKLFEAFFRNPDLAQKLLTQLLPAAPQKKKPDSQPRARAQQALSTVKKQPEKPRESLQLDAAMTASTLKRLRHADFQSLNASEFQLVERLVRQIPLLLPRIPGRRSLSGLRGPCLDGARTLRMAAQYEGEVLRLLQRKRRLQHLPLLLLVDISGSMERYARLMLVFLHQATRHIPHAGFALGTELSDLRPAFEHSDPDTMLEALNHNLHDFGGGTHLGHALSVLRQQARTGLSGRRTVVLLISDGLDTGDSAQLSQELGWLKRHCRSLLWLNPLLRFEGYAPLAAGAQSLLQYADGMLAIHNLERLEQLACAIAQLVSGTRPHNNVYSTYKKAHAHGT